MERSECADSCRPHAPGESRSRTLNLPSYAMPPTGRRDPV